MADRADRRRVGQSNRSRCLGERKPVDAAYEGDVIVEHDHLQRASVREVGDVMGRVRTSSRGDRIARGVSTLSNCVSASAEIWFNVGSRVT